MRKNGWAIYDKYVMRQVEQMSHVSRYLKGGFFAFEFLDGAAETFDAYREGKNWTRVAVRESVKVFTTYALPAITDGVLLLLSLTPVGWVAIICVAAAEATEVMLADHYIDNTMR